MTVSLIALLVRSVDGGSQEYVNRWRMVAKQTADAKQGGAAMSRMCQGRADARRLTSKPVGIEAL